MSSQKSIPPSAVDQQQSLMTETMAETPSAPPSTTATGMSSTTTSAGAKISKSTPRQQQRLQATPIRGDVQVASNDSTALGSSAGSTETSAREMPQQPELETESVGKIRDILFGEQMQSYDSRFAELEEHIQRESRRSQEELERRFSRLDSFMRDEFEKISDRLQQESNDRVEAAQSTISQLTDAEARVAMLVKDLGSELRREHGNIRDDLDARNTEQMAQLDRSRNELMKTLNDNESRLRHEKLDRESLADMLIGVADKLRTQEAN